MITIIVKVGGSEASRALSVDNYKVQNMIYIQTNEAHSFKHCLRSE